MAFAEFPFRYLTVPSQGLVFYPFILIDLKTAVGWRKVDFLIDTGADVTTLPRYAATWLGLEREKLAAVKIQGVAGAEIDGWETAVSIKIGRHAHTIRALITNDNKTPFLLGRADLLDEALSLLFDSSRKKIRFDLL